MKSSSFILFPSDTTWTIVAPDGRELEATDAAGAVAMLRPGQLVMLALPSAWCLPVTFDSVRADRKAALFQMEEKLPVAAEDVTADIVSSGRKSMGVCVRTDRLRDLVKLVDRRRSACADDLSRRDACRSSRRGWVALALAIERLCGCGGFSGWKTVGVGLVVGVGGRCPCADARRFAASLRSRQHHRKTNGRRAAAGDPNGATVPGGKAAAVV